MGLIDYLHIASRRWLIIVATTLLGGAIAAAYTATTPKTYEASSRLYVTMATGTSVNDAYQGGLAAQQRVTSYVDLATSYSIADQVINDLGLSMSPSELQSKIKATFPPGTAVLDISVTDESANRAKLLTDKVVEKFRALVDHLETTVTGAAPAARVSVVDRAQTPTTPTGPNSKFTRALGLVAGFVLGCLAAFVRERFDRTLRTSNDLARILPVPALASINVGEPDAEGETRRLRARLTQARGDIDAMTLLVTSFSTRSEPEVAITLSKAFAYTGRRVALVDADTTGHGSSDRLPVVSDSGLAELLRTTSSPVDALRTWSEAEISVLPLGGVDVHTSDLLASERFAEIVSKFRDRFDYVVVEAAPVTSAADALAISAHCDGAIGVVELGTTTSHQVRDALSTFNEGGSGLLGAVAVSNKSGNWLRRSLRRLRRPVHHPKASGGRASGGRDQPERAPVPHDQQQRHRVEPR
jgi:capsular polysaccharide biosynthesis protein/Mrp family chromosome partitioning ATPase